MERGKLVSAAWLIAGFVALAPAMLFILMGILFSLTLLPTLAKTLANPDRYTLTFIARTIAETIGGCAGLIAAWMGILIPEKLQRRPKLKRIFLVLACAGLAAISVYIPDKGWRHQTLALWVVLGPVIIGACGLCRVFRRQSFSIIEGPE